jgi:transcriptional regulator with XRE-family HTH domain
MDFMKIGDKIRSAREDMDLSQEEVARLIPINQSSYSKIERDIQEPNLEQLRRICQILNLDPAYLLSLDKFENANSTDFLFAKEVKKVYQKIYNNKTHD